MDEQLKGGDEMMEKNRRGRAGSALAVLLSLGLAAACEDPAPEEPAVTAPGQMPPGQAPMADPGEPPAEGDEEEPSR